VGNTHRLFRVGGCWAERLWKGLVGQGSHTANWISYTDSLQSLFSILVCAHCPESYWPVTKIADCPVKMRGFFQRWRESVTFVSFPSLLCYVTSLWSLSFRVLKASCSFQSLQTKRYNLIPVG